MDEDLFKTSHGTADVVHLSRNLEKFKISSRSRRRERRNIARQCAKANMSAIGNLVDPDDATDNWHIPLNPTPRVRDPLHDLSPLKLTNPDRFKRLVRVYKVNVDDLPITCIRDPMNQLWSKSLATLSTELKHHDYTPTSSFIIRALTDTLHPTPTRRLGIKIGIYPPVRSLKQFRRNLYEMHPSPEDLTPDFISLVWSLLSNSREFHRWVSLYCLFRQLFEMSCTLTDFDRVLAGSTFVAMNLKSVMRNCAVEIHDLKSFARPNVHREHILSVLRVHVTQLIEAYRATGNYDIGEATQLLFDVLKGSRVSRPICYSPSEFETYTRLAGFHDRFAPVADLYHEELAARSQGAIDIGQAFATFIGVILDTPAIWLVAAICLLVKALVAQTAVAAATYTALASMCMGMTALTSVTTLASLVGALQRGSFTVHGRPLDIGFFTQLAAQFKPVYAWISTRIGFSDGTDANELQTFVHILPPRHLQNPFLSAPNADLPHPTQDVPPTYAAFNAIYGILSKSLRTPHDATPGDLLDSFKATAVSISVPSDTLNPALASGYPYFLSLANFDMKGLPPHPFTPIGDSTLHQFALHYNIKTRTRLDYLYAYSLALAHGYVVVYTDDDTTPVLCASPLLTVRTAEASLEQYLARHGVIDIWLARRYFHANLSEHSNGIADYMKYVDLLEPCSDYADLRDLLQDTFPVANAQNSAGFSAPFLSFWEALSNLFGSPPTLASTAKKASQLSALWRCFTDGQKIKDYVTPFFTSACNWLCEFLGIEPLFAEPLVKARKLLTKGRTRLSELSLALAARSDVAKIVQDLDELSYELVDIKAHLAMVADNAPEHAQLIKYSADLRDTMTTAVAADVATRARCAPVCLLFAGPAGKGKTQFTQFLANALTRIRTRDGIVSYLRNPDTVVLDMSANFQDAVTTQATWILDEFLTINNADTRTKHAEFVIKNVNTIPYLVEKASIEEKNKYWAANQLLILTSNSTTSVLSNVVADPIAIERRIDFSVTIDAPPLVDGMFPQTPDGHINWDKFSFTLTTLDIEKRERVVKPQHSRMTAMGVVYEVAALLALRGAQYRNSAAGVASPVYAVSDRVDLPPPVIPPCHVPALKVRESVTSLTDTERLPNGIHISRVVETRAQHLPLPDLSGEILDTVSSLIDLTDAWSPYYETLLDRHYDNAIPSQGEFYATVDEVVCWGIPDPVPTTRAEYVQHMQTTDPLEFEWDADEDVVSTFAPYRNKNIKTSDMTRSNAYLMAALLLRRAVIESTGTPDATFATFPTEVGSLLSPDVVVPPIAPHNPALGAALNRERELPPRVRRPFRRNRNEAQLETPVEERVERVFRILKPYLSKHATFVPSTTFVTYITNWLSHNHTTMIPIRPLPDLLSDNDTYTSLLVLKVRDHYRPTSSAYSVYVNRFKEGAKYYVEALRSMFSLTNLRERAQQLADAIRNFSPKRSFFNKIMGNLWGLDAPIIAVEWLTGKTFSPLIHGITAAVSATLLLALVGIGVGFGVYHTVQYLWADKDLSTPTKPFDFPLPDLPHSQGLRYGSGDQERYRNAEIHETRRRGAHRNRKGAAHKGGSFGGVSMYRTGGVVHHSPKASMPQAQAPENNLAIAIRATCWLINADGLELRALGVAQQMICFPHHYLFAFRQNPRLTYTDGRVSLQLDARELPMIHLPEKDLVFAWLPLQAPAFPDIIDRFIIDNDLLSLPKRIEFALVTRTSAPISCIIDVPSRPVIHTWTAFNIDNENQDYDGTTVYSSNAIVSMMRRSPGDCGSLYSMSDPRAAPRCLLGIHVAGNENTSYCTVITSDLLYDVLDSFHEAPDDPVVLQGPAVSSSRRPQPTTTFPSEPSIKDAVTILISDEDQQEYTFPVAVAPHTMTFREHSRTEEHRAGVNQYNADAAKGIADLQIPASALYLGQTAEYVHSSEESRYAPGPLSQYLPAPEVEERPALLKPTEPYGDPLVKALERQKPLPIHSYDPVVMQECATAVFDKVTKHARRSVWTLERAILGHGSLGALDRSAAPGYPWDSLASAAGKPAEKGSFFQAHTTTELVRGRQTVKVSHLEVDPNLARAVNNAMTLLKTGVAPDWAMKCALKDEIVPLEKIQACKTRMYYVCPLDHAIVCRMLFGDIMSQCLIDRTVHPGQVGCSVGLSPTDGVIRQFQQLHTLGEHFPFAADQKGWDNHQHWKFAEYVVNAVNNWYPHTEPQDIKVARRTYVMSCYNSIYVLRGTVYRMPFGLPSGVAITSQLNSWYLEMVSLYSVRLCMSRDYKLALTVSQMKSQMFGLYYGDDSWILIPKLWRVTSKDMFAIMTSIGLEATHSIKNFPLDQEVPFSEQTFLKRSIFLNADGHLVFALPKTTLEGQFTWTLRKHMYSVPVLMSTIRAHLEEAARHGVDYFNTRASLIREACLEAGYTLTAPTDIAAYSGLYL